MGVENHELSGGCAEKQNPGDPGPNTFCMEDVQAGAYSESTDSVAEVMASKRSDFLLQIQSFSNLRSYIYLFHSIPSIHVPAEPASTWPSLPEPAEDRIAGCKEILHVWFGALIWVRERNFGQGNTCLGT